MNMKNYAYAAVLLLAACSTEPKREIVYDYVISNASTNKKPEWTDSEYILDLNNKGDGFKYYVGENNNLASQGSKSLCRTASETQARRDLAAAIESNIKSAYKEVENSSGQGENTVVSSSANIDNALNIDTVIKGVEKVKDYWEERFHKVSMNAPKDYKSYACFTLVRMKDSSYEEVIKAATNTMIDKIKSSNASKEEVKDLKDKIVNEAISAPLSVE